ncbi:PREDICTED: wall-associated receptor kinase-like 10 [Lupinus angustifolius]|uniref:wall-associated receptor kinase-like 10 n=1 Tax=Lupinus angustifolius TaxID=3871 RepID=UPI00092EE8C7|nr:PREDICTED: wall-associated receptor kinase-like 10 [Lupinus angustifolius]
MILQFAIHMIIFICSIYPLASAQSDCVSTCGSVNIPYPFGMNNPNCYLGKWFEIECRNATSVAARKPYLKYIDMEVTKIDETYSTVDIMNPIFRWNCYGKTDMPVIDLRGSPFVYSQKYDKFIAFGCNKLAFLQSNGTTVGGCVSICDNNEEVNNNFDFGINGCHGRYCCETSLPLYLSEYNTTHADLKNKSSDECNYALIVSEDWLTSYNNYDMLGMTFIDLKNIDYVPAVLEWEILNESMINSTLEFSLHSFCNHSYITSSSQNKNSSGVRCRCLPGFYGSPYISGGCTAIPPIFEVKNRSRKWAIVGSSSSLGSIILLFGLWWSYKVVRKRVIKKRKENFFKQNGGLLLQRKLSSDEVCVDKTILFTLKDLERATNNFNMNRVLGKGGQGTVYKGMLEDGKIVAVKKFKVQGKVEEFINEFVILSQINHRNVVKLLGCCLETEIPLLVYEFIPNGNLFEYLHNQNEDLAMTWDIRLRIATEIAGALFYLHSIASQPIYHRDIKSTNILLDEKNRAKVADFGTSRIVSIEATHLTTMVQGTFGYLDPEYFHTSQFTDKSDVYSFGVVLAEILTGRRPIPVVSSEEAMNLASYFVLSMEENNLFDIIDKRLEKEADKEHIIAVANLAYTCLELNGRKRPTMKEVTLELERIGVPNRKFSTNQNHEGIELSRIEDYQHFGGYSMSNTFSTISSQTFS